MRTFLLEVCCLVGFMVTAAGCAGTSPRFTSSAGEAPPTRDLSVHQLSGIASYYADEFHGRQTANGEEYNMYALTAAHRTLPFNTTVKVTHLQTGESVVVRINDRGPFKDDRVIDLSLGAARRIGLIDKGTGPVRLDVLELGAPGKLISE
jgi:rare lipoprotein A